MKNKHLFSLLASFILVLLLSSCSGSKYSASSSDNAERVQVGSTVTGLQPQVSLASYLQQLSGVTVMGSGSNAKVYIRGVNVTEGGAKEPMFVIDGIPAGYSYAEVDNAIDVNDIEKLTVVKGPDATMDYGMQGSNGVVEIKTKGGN